MKRILLSLSAIALSFAATSQVLINDDFENYTLGNVMGQPYYYTQSTSSDHAESDFQIVNITGGSKGVQITGQSAAQSTKFMYTSTGWSSRDAGNDVMVFSFTLKASDITTSKNNYRMAVHDASGNVIGGFGYYPETKELYGRIGTTVNGTSGVYRYDFLNSGATAYTLTENSEIDLEMIFDKTDGAVYLLGFVNNTNVFVVADVSDYQGVDPSTLRFYSLAGTSNAASAMYYIDNVYLQAKPCVLYSTKDDASFSYSSTALCNTASALAPVKTDNTVTGTFTSSPAGLTIDATTGSITPGTSTAGTYTVQFASNVANTCDDSTTVSITINDCSGLPEHYSSSFSVSPNPANQFVNVTLADNVFEGTIRLISSEGKEVEVREVSANRTESFNVSNLERGIYFIQLGDKIEKVVVQ
jgi:hypothetical protein